MSGINEQVINAEIYQVGPQGIPGEAATISVGTVTTGEPGTDASVTNSGTSSAAILDFVIPQGEQGLQGIQGPQGIQGLIGATGNGISSIEKIATVGLTDTYRITFTNNTYYDFEVINGSSISDIEKTNTSGLVDTYTITLTNGNTHTFTVTNGAKGDKGETGEVGNGILGVNKMSTTGLVDNYRMTFTNGTYFDFDVTNAKSIVSISKISASGLIDTYRITFNDNTNFQFPVTNGRGVTGVTLLSWEGLEKTYRMSFNDGSHFDFVVTNGAGSQVDWGGIYGVLSQQTDLQDALVQSNGLTMGSVSTYNVMLKELIERAHSTFDLSKFDVVGSPNITDDGVVSGFSSGNYLKSTYNLEDGKTYTFVMGGIGGTPRTDRGSLIFTASFSNREDDSLRLITSVNTGILRFALGRGTADVTTGIAILDGVKYKIELTTDFKSFVTITDLLTGYTLTKANYSITGQIYGIHDIVYGIRNNFAPLTSGSIDLKQFSITIDGVEVFSGNKTGIDTIKPDDYTVVGTPTISADGVASGFSSSNYVTFALNSSTSQNWEMEFIIKTPASNSIIENYNAIISRSSTPFQLYCAKSVNSSTVGYWHLELGENKILNMTLYWNTNYKLSIVNHNGIITLNVLNLDTNNTDSISTPQTYEIYLNGTWRLGLTQSGNFGFQGSIDLNAFKIYVDGNLVYQPCLKIPYTESKTGSKIVNAIYRDRVNDMASQFGYANYYTLDEDNGNFTLPQVELPGLIGNKTLRDSYYNGATYWELYSNRRLEQGGSCESGVEYTFPKPFADSNYILTIPYSSKTATSFIPSATGDFIAKGTGLL